MTAEEELEPLLAELRRTHDVLPFMQDQIPADEAAWRPMPDEMVDVMSTSQDFRAPERGGLPVWLQLEGPQGDGAVLIVATPLADGELWVIARKR